MKHGNPLIAIFSIALLATGLGFGFRYGVRDDLFARNFGVVEAGKVYRSGRQTPAMMKRIVETNKIKTIIDLGAYPENSIEERQSQAVAQALGVRRVRFFLQGDGTGDPNAYVSALRVMLDPVYHPVLVHCATGAQRTGACVMLYRLAAQGKSLAETYPEAQRYKHVPGRNPYLMPYLKQWGEKIVDALASTGRIPYNAGAAPTHGGVE